MIADVAPFTLGVKVAGGAKDQMVSGLFSPIIPRNCKVPVSRTETYYTTFDNQRAARCGSGCVLKESHERIGIRDGSWRIRLSAASTGDHAQT